MAAARETLQETQRDITCGICRKKISEAVTMGCQHNCCQACLFQSRRAETTVFSCPQCGQVAQIREIPGVSRNLGQMVDLGNQFSCQFLLSPEGQNQCDIHKEVFKFFCEEDLTLLCERCCQTLEHEAHRLSSIDEAAQNVREKFYHIQRHLRKYFVEARKLLAQEERPVINWEKMILEEYWKLNLFLTKAEKQCAERVEQELKVNEDRLEHHKGILQDFSRDLQEAEDQSDVELLQEIKQLLARSESVLSQRIKPVNSHLRYYPIPGMLEIVQRSRVDFRLDPTSAGAWATVSEDLRSVKVVEGWQEVINHPGDSPGYYIFAEQSFGNVGNCWYWEVDVTQLPQWTLGIHTPYLEDTDEDEWAVLFLLTCVKKEEGYFFQSYPGSLNHRVSGPVPRIGVYLQYSPGTIIFFDVLQRCPITLFNAMPFSEPITPIFSPGPPLPGTEPGAMTVCPVDSHICACCYSIL